MLKSFKKINQLLDHKQKATMVFLVFVRVVTLIFGWLEDEIRSISYRAMSLE